MASQPTTIETLHYVRCSWGNESVALDMSWVRGIERTDLLRPSPAQDGQEGWLPSREGDIPVFSLPKQLGRPVEATHAQGRILVLNSPSGREGRPWGLLVERVSRVNQISKDHLVPLPPITVNPQALYFRGIIKSRDELILLLSPDQLHPDAKLPPVASSVPVPADPMPTSSIGKKTPRQKQILVFSTNKPPAGERPVSFALNIGLVPEVLDVIPQIPIPGAPSFVLGLGNWRGRPVPIIDLNIRLGLPFSTDLSADERRRILIARVGRPESERLAGLVIRSQVRTLQLPVAHKPSTRSLPLLQPLIRGMVELDHETVLIPNLQALL